MFIELPRSLNIPENCVCYIDDIVIPVSWSTVDARNNKLYVYVDYEEQDYEYVLITIPAKNYTGQTRAETLMTLMHAAFEGRA